MRGFEKAMKWLESFCRERSRLCLALFSVVYFAGEGLRAARRPFWFDELATFYVARTGLPAIWSVLGRVGEMNHPPLPLWLASLSQRLFGVTELGTRVPALIAFWIACLMLYAIVRRHLAPSWSFAAVLLVFFSGAEYYATEARAYSIVMAAGTIAFYCWQTPPELRRRWTVPLLAISVCAAISSHYLAVLLLVPLGVAEAVRSVRRRTIDYAVWLAWLVALAPLAIYLPRMLLARSVYGAHNTNPANLDTAVKSYVLLLETLTPVLLIAMAGLVVWARGDRFDSLEPVTGVLPEEAVAVVGLCFLPLVALAAGPFTNALHARYVIMTVTGAILLFVFLCGRFLDRRAASGAVCLGLALSVFFGIQLSRAAAFIARRGAVLGQEPVAASNIPSDLPIVADSPLSYFPLAHYGAPALRSRLHFIASPLDSARTTGSDSLDLFLLRFQQITPFHVDTYPGLFGQPGARFLLYVSNVYPNGWTLDRAVALGGRVTYLRKLDDENTAYLVEMPERRF